MTRRRLSKSDIKSFASQLGSLAVDFSKKDEIDRVEDELGVSYWINGELSLFELGGRLLPHLRLLQSRPALLRKVTVDMGAIKFVANGADIMRPGIVAIDEGISAGDLVAVVDQVHGKALAVGEALLASEAMRNETHGKVIHSLHFVGDRYWLEKASKLD